MVVRGLKTTQKSLAATVATAMLSFALVTPVAQAQETTAEVRGVVVNTSGAPLEGATTSIFYQYERASSCKLSNQIFRI